MPVLFKLKDHFQENKLFLNRTVAATVFMLVLLLILVSRVIFLQIYQHERYVTLAHNNQVRMLPSPPTRGLIYDRNGILLAENIPTFSLEIVPNRVKNLKKIINDLSKIINISKEDSSIFYRQLKYKSPYESVPIRNKLTEEEVASFSVQKYQFPEIEVVARLSRHYPHGKIFAHALGYIGSISEKELTNIDLTKYRGIHQIGKSGLEKSYEDILQGKVGYKQVETDVRGRIIRTLSSTSPIPGHNLTTTIDSKLQKAAYEALNEYQGAIVAIDIQSGGILILASNPSFDPNIFIKGDKESYHKLQSTPNNPLFNRAIRGQYPPGSIIKPLVALQALDTGIITPNLRIYDPGYYKLNDDSRLFHGWNRAGHGFINLENALAESCGTFFYATADKLGIDKIHDIFSRFGLGQYTGIDIIGEAKGLAPSVAWKQEVKKSKWFTGDTLNTGMGQGYMLATPLQMAQIAATIANHGKIIQPTLIKHTQYQDKNPVQQNIIYKDPIKLSNDKHWHTVIKGMEKTIKSPRGTAHKIYKENSFAIAGKTGTAQIFSLKQDEEYESESIEKHLRDNSLFIAFAPVEKPKIAIAIIIEHVKQSSKIARLILDEYFKEEQGKHG